MFQFGRNKFYLLGIPLLLCMILLVSSLSVFGESQFQVPKYVFLFIGDGMSYPQVSSTVMYLGNQKSLEY